MTARPVAAAGHRVATQAARLWGRLLSGEERQVGELTVISGLPTWAFGRGGTTVGATFLTRSATSPGILAHEDVHRRQWERYGLWFIPMYFAAGLDGLTNKWEIEAGLELGGYLPKRPPSIE
ncbi:Fe-S oxidoreductase [Agrococcus sp. TF02-5]|nr:Fe-S oxidoreductase [Agrococcus sp. TF02-05]